MNDMPEQAPMEPENPATPAEGASGEVLQSAPCPADSYDLSPESNSLPGSDPQTPPLDADPLMFRQFQISEMPRQERIPNMGHLGILCVLALCGLFLASLLARSALYFHLFGVTTLKQAVTDIHYTLGTEGAFYLLTFGCCLIVFPMIWRKGLLEGLHWRGTTALRLRTQLMTAAALCFLLAILNGVLMPGPSNAPIDIIFRTPGAAWLLFGFGITLAPFFEEMAFRGFLLPALCTAFDWIGERATDTQPRPLDVNGHPQWSLPAMCIAAVFTSLPFALMHAEQTGYSLGPFLLLIFVSLVLCWARLSTRSLAASVLVHTTYNFLLFSLMLFGTGGFRHLDKM